MAAHLDRESAPGALEPSKRRICFYTDKNPGTGRQSWREEHPIVSAQLKKSGEVLDRVRAALLAVATESLRNFLRRTSLAFGNIMSKVGQADGRHSAERFNQAAPYF